MHRCGVRRLDGLPGFVGPVLITHAPQSCDDALRLQLSHHLSGLLVLPVPLHTLLTVASPVDAAISFRRFVGQVALEARSHPHKTWGFWLQGLQSCAADAGTVRLTCRLMEQLVKESCSHAHCNSGAAFIVATIPGDATALPLSLRNLFGVWAPAATPSLSLRDIEELCRTESASAHADSLAAADCLKDASQWFRHVSQLRHTAAGKPSRPSPLGPLARTDGQLAASNAVPADLLSSHFVLSADDFTPETAAPAATSVPLASSAAEMRDDHNRDIAVAGPVAHRPWLPPSLVSSVERAHTAAIARLRELVLADARGHILIRGARGSGKTLLLRYVAATFPATPQFIRLRDVLRSGVGESEAALLQIFRRAEQTGSLTILVFDDVHALFPAPSAKEHDETSRTWSGLAAVMQRCLENTGDSTRVVASIISEHPLRSSLLGPTRFEHVLSL